MLDPFFCPSSAHSSATTSRETTSPDSSSGFSKSTPCGFRSNSLTIPPSILYTYWAPYVTLVSVYQANLSGHTKKVTLYAWFYISWAIGNIIGPQTFREEQAPVYTGGTVAMIVCYAVAMVCVLAYGFLCRLSNKKRASVIESQLAADQDWLDLTDKQNKAFRYTT